MAVPFLALLLLLGSYCSVVAANFNLPFFSPSFGNPCRENVCGKGSCVTSNNSTFGFECECQHGWKQARSQDDDHLKFLPCVIPNCTLNHACTKAPAPAANNHKKPNLSFFDPCFWADCGGGSCNATSPFTHTCLCEEGYYNLFNSTAFPCYKECEIGFDCSNLGINMMPSPPPSPDDSKSHGEHPFAAVLVLFFLPECMNTIVNQLNCFVLQMLIEFHGLKMVKVKCKDL